MPASVGGRGSWGRSSPGVVAYVADLDGPHGFSTKSCDSGEFCTTKHPHLKGVIFDQTPSLEGGNLRPNTLTTYQVQASPLMLKITPDQEKARIASAVQPRQRCAVLRYAPALRVTHPASSLSRRRESETVMRIPTLVTVPSTEKRGRLTV